MAKQKGKGGAKKPRGGKQSSSVSSCSSSKGGGSTGGNNGKKNKKSHQQNNYNKWQQTSDDDEDDATFRRNLLDQGNVVQEMNADGNCLFRSLSDQLHRDLGARHDVVRHDVCDHLARNKEEFRHFLLMDDDDEDVLGIDDYIEKMREDGEWGGNVEVVVASRVYGRDVKVFSGEYSNGVLSIICDDKGDDPCEDLLLSYHGNNHYNSVHPIGGRKARPTKSTCSNRRATTDNKSNKRRGAAASTGEESESNDRSMKLQIDTAGGNRTRSRPPTRGSNCPCGSGLKYKKCCMAQEKSRRRLAKHSERHNDGDETSNVDEKKDDEYIGEFKVLTI